MNKNIIIGILAVGVILLGLTLLLPHSPKLGTTSAVSTASQFEDIELNNQAGYGNASLYVNGTKYTDSSGDWLGNILQTGATQLAVVNDLILASAGYSLTVNTSTALTAAQFCGTTHFQVLGTSALATTTLPAATSTYNVCGANAGLGSYSTQLISNNSTNTANFVAGTGTTFRCADIGVGTTTNSGVCTASQVSLTTSSDVFATGYWTGTSTQIIVWSTQSH